MGGAATGGIVKMSRVAMIRTSFVIPHCSLSLTSKLLRANNLGEQNQLCLLQRLLIRSVAHIVSATWARPCDRAFLSKCPFALGTYEQIVGSFDAEAGQYSMFSFPQYRNPHTSRN